VNTLFKFTMGGYLNWSVLVSTFYEKLTRSAMMLNTVSRNNTFRRW